MKFASSEAELRQDMVVQMDYQRSEPRKYKWESRQTEVGKEENQGWVQKGYCFVQLELSPIVEALRYYVNGSHICPKKEGGSWHIVHWWRDIPGVD